MNNEVSNQISNYNVNTLLPYDIPNEKEYLKTIKENIALALLSKSYSKEAQFWFKELNRYNRIFKIKNRNHFVLY